MSELLPALLGGGISAVGMALLVLAFLALRDGPARARNLVAAVILLGVLSVALRGYVLGELLT